MRTARLLGLVLVFALLSGGDCNIGDLGNILDSPGTITVTNISDDETAVVQILADDLSTYPTLHAGGSATATTNVGGTYRVKVVMTPENAQAYHDDLLALRALVEKQISGSASPVEKTRLFLDLSGIKAAILALENASGASCSGRIQLDEDQSVEVHASLAWHTTTSGAGFWDLVCGSN